MPTDDRYHGYVRGSYCPPLREPVAAPPQKPTARKHLVYRPTFLRAPVDPDHRYENLSDVPPSRHG